MSYGTLERVAARFLLNEPWPNIGTSYPFAIQNVASRQDGTFLKRSRVLPFEAEETCRSSYRLNREMVSEAPIELSGRRGFIAWRLSAKPGWQADQKRGRPRKEVRSGDRCGGGEPTASTRKVGKPWNRLEQPEWAGSVRVREEPALSRRSRPKEQRLKLDGDRGHRRKGTSVKEDEPTPYGKSLSLSVP